MKPWLVFAFDRYYPSGGALDIVADVDTEEEARALIQAIPDTESQHAQILGPEKQAVFFQRENDWDGPWVEDHQRWTTDWLAP